MGEMIWQRIFVSIILLAGVCFLRENLSVLLIIACCFAQVEMLWVVYGSSTSLLKKNAILVFFGLYSAFFLYTLHFIHDLFRFIFAVFVCDTSAYLFGKFFKKISILYPIFQSKLNESPFLSISRNKTFGGYLFGILFGTFAFIFLFSNILNGSLKILWASFVSSVSAHLGDLFMSYIKRILLIKDFSKILPGHGGILDRLDSLYLSSIFYYILVICLK